MLQKRAARTIGLGVLAGLIAGGILATLQIVLVRPFVDSLSGEWLGYQTATGQFDEDLFNQQLQSIYLYGVAGSLAVGVAAGALVGAIIAFAGRTAMAGHAASGSRIGMAVAITGVLWFVFTVVPSVKYPVDPTAIFDPSVASQFDLLLGAYTALSGASALGSILLFKRFARRTKWFGAAALYLTLIAVISVVFPEIIHPDQPFAQGDIASWRAALSASNAAFWLLLGLIAGILVSRGASEQLIDQQQHPG